MPPLGIKNYEPDGDGGWLIQWRDIDNANGEAVEAFIQITPELVNELVQVRGLYKSPATPMDDAVQTLVNDRATMRAQNGNAQNQRAVLGIPANVTPYAVRDFIDGYGMHIQDCKDKHEMGIHGAAPYDVLESVRNGGEIPTKWRRPEKGGVSSELQNFIDTVEPSE